MNRQEREDTLNRLSAAQKVNRSGSWVYAAITLVSGLAMLFGPSLGLISPPGDPDEALIVALTGIASLVCSIFFIRLARSK